MDTYRYLWAVTIVSSSANQNARFVIVGSTSWFILNYIHTFQFWQKHDFSRATLNRRISLIEYIHTWKDRQVLGVFAFSKHLRAWRIKGNGHTNIKIIDLPYFLHYKAIDYLVNASLSIIIIDNTSVSIPNCFA